MPFRATLRQHYRLNDNALLVLEEDYEGDIGAGDELLVDVDGAPVRVTVHDLAWGSTLNAARLPLSLIVVGLEDHPPEPGASIRSPDA